MQPTDFELNKLHFLRGLRSIARAASAAFVALLLVRLNSYASVSDEMLLLAAAACLLCLLLVAKAYLGLRERSLTLRIHENGVCIPRLLRSPIEVSFDDIKSVEVLGSPESPMAVTIGRYSTAAVFIEAKVFSCPAAATSFATLICEVIRHRGRERVMHPAYEGASVFKRNAVTTCTALLLLLAYVATSASENLAFTAMRFIDEYGLTKSITIGSELYRLASSFFVHMDPGHLLVNLLSLAALGRQLERVLGGARLLVVLAASTLAGSLTSLQFSSADVVVGASGGIFGLFGAYVYVRWRFKAEIPGSSDTLSTLQIAVALALQLIFDLASEDVDMSSHAGGFLGGLMCAYVLSRLQGARFLAGLRERQYTQLSSDDPS